MTKKQYIWYLNRFKLFLHPSHPPLNMYLIETDIIYLFLKTIDIIIIIIIL